MCFVLRLLAGEYTKPRKLIMELEKRPLKLASGFLYIVVSYNRLIGTKVEFLEKIEAFDMSHRETMKDKFALF